MFAAEGFALTDSHIDLSFQRADRWTKVGPAPGSPPSLWISLGDPVCGPAIQLGICPPVAEKMWLDTHYHASDQLRAVIAGDFQLQRKHMKRGDFGYQVSGIPYREGLVGGGSADLWMFAIQGDRRGARSTTTRSDGSFMLGDVAEDQLDRPVESATDPYWDCLPGGAKGVPALAVSQGRIVGGFAWGSFSEADAWLPLEDGAYAAFALLGEIDAGPIAVTVRANRGATIVPALTCATEMVIAVVDGNVRIGGQDYGAGDVRIQRVGAPLAAILAGTDGADCVCMIADRRADLDIADNPASRLWRTRVSDVVTQLSGILRAPSTATLAT